MAYPPGVLRKHFVFVKEDMVREIGVVRCRATFPEEAGNIRDEGLCLWALGQHSECADCLTEYLAAAPGALDALEVRIV